MLLAFLTDGGNEWGDCLGVDTGRNQGNKASLNRKTRLSIGIEGVCSKE